jgi:hypothetical protein
MLDCLGNNESNAFADQEQRPGHYFKITKNYNFAKIIHLKMIDCLSTNESNDFSFADQEQRSGHYFKITKNYKVSVSDPFGTPVQRKNRKT